MSLTRYYIAVSIDEVAAFKVGEIGGVPILSDHLDLFVDMEDGKPHWPQLADIVKSLTFVPSTDPAYAEIYQLAKKNLDEMIEELRVSTSSYNDGLRLAKEFNLRLRVDDMGHPSASERYIEPVVQE